MAFTILFTVAPNKQSNAFIIGAIVKAALKKILNAIDLKIQKLQNKTIALQNAQKELENAMSKLKLNQIKDWADKEKKLFAGYYDELAKVKAAIATYQRVKQIIREQVTIADEYKTAYNLFRNDTHFTPEELDHIYRVYSGLIDESLRNLDELYLIINSLQTTMTDGKRLELIAAVANKMDKIKVSLRQFNQRNQQISLNRSRNLQELQSVRQYYGLAL